MTTIWIWFVLEKVLHRAIFLRAGRVMTSAWLSAVQKTA